MWDEDKTFHRLQQSYIQPNTKLNSFVYIWALIGNKWIRAWAELKHRFRLGIFVKSLIEFGITND